MTVGAQLKATVFVKDPDTRQTVELAPGTCPEPRLASLVTNPAAWVDGKLPACARRASPRPTRPIPATVTPPTRTRTPTT